MGDSPISVTLAGDLSKPANTLIEKISDALGGYFKPYQIRRVAGAEADAAKIRAGAEAEAAKIRAYSETEIVDIQRRALHRFLAEEAKKQNNIETITLKALPQVNEQATPQNVEDDWITNFFDKCRLISDDQMQNLWAKVLAGEANAPGKYSKRTVNLLAGLDKSDAEAFTNLCSFAFNFGRDMLPLVYDVKDEIYKQHGVNFVSVSQLDSIGLVHFDSFLGYQQTGLKSEGFIYYFGNQVWIGFDKSEGNSMAIGHVLLTKAGKQLAPICESKPRDGFIEYVREKWKSLNYRVDPNAQQGAAPSAKPAATV